jgi:putative ABC transport system permease protein
LLGHYLTIALRGFAHHKVHALLGILSLALGLMTFTAAFVLVEYLASSESYFPDASRIYTVYQQLSFGGLPLPLSPMSSAALAESLRADLPQLTVARENSGGAVATVAGKPTAVNVGGVDPEFLEIFPLQYVVGAGQASLAPGKAIVTEKAAVKLFRTRNVLGKTLTLNDRTEVSVSAVSAEIPQPSHLSGSAFWGGFDVLVSWDAFQHLRLEQRSAGAKPPDPWGNFGVFTQVLLPADGSLTVGELNRRLEGVAARHVPPRFGTGHFEARHVSRLLPDFYQSLFLGQTMGVISLGGVLLLLGGLTLVVGLVNFVNLATAQAARRAREIGIRKALGASPGRVVRQHLAETFVTALAAFAIAVLGVYSGLFVAARFWRVAIAPPSQAVFWAFAAALLAGVTVAAGSYPALVLARVQPAAALRAGAMPGGSARLRALLTVVQFAAAGVLVIAVAVMLTQNRTLRRMGLPKTDDTLVMISANLHDAGVSLESLATELRRSPAVRNVTATDMPPWSFSFGGGRLSRSRDKSADTVTVQGRRIGYDYFETLGVRLLAGRAFSRERAADVAPSSPDETKARSEPIKIIIDRTAVDRFGFASPQAAVGQLLYGSRQGPGEEVIGVVDDVPLTLVALSDSFVYELDPNLATSAIVAIKRDQVAAGLAAIDAAWQRVAPAYPLKRSFLDDGFDEAYGLFATVNRVIGTLAVLAFVIAGTGLFGVASYMVARRVGEIAVRKAHGASGADVVKLLAWEFARPVLIANAIAWPIGFVAMRAYLNLFVQRTALTPLPFLLSLALTLAIAWAAVAVHVLAVARVKPAAVLRYP